MILDVGCGGVRLGDVAVDLFPEETLQVSQDGRYVKIDRGELFVAASASALPFRDAAFDAVYCFHVLEHLRNPFQALKELCRVIRRFVEVEVPHRLSVHGKMPFHVSYFNSQWFRDAAKTLGVEAVKPIVGIRMRLPIPVGYIRTIFKLSDDRSTVELQQEKEDGGDQHSKDH